MYLRTTQDLSFKTDLDPGPVLRDNRLEAPLIFDGLSQRGIQRAGGLIGNVIVDSITRPQIASGQSGSLEVSPYVGLGMDRVTPGPDIFRNL